MPTQQQVWCEEIDQLIDNPATCTADLLRQMKNVIRLLSEVAGCSGNCNTVNYVYVDEGTLTSEFIDVGWGGVRPSAALHPLLYVIRGCEVFIGVNNSLCDLESGLGWCPLCTARVKQVALLVLAPEQALSQSASYNPRPTTGEWSIEFNNGVSLAIGGQPRLDTPMVNVPTHCFQVDAGLHQIDVSFSEQYVSTPPNGNNSFDMRLFDVTNNVALFTQHKIKIDLVGSAPHHFTVFVNPVVPTIYRLESRISHVASSGYASSGYDNLLIERIA